MLQVRNLSKTYASGGRVVDAIADLDLDISEGDFVVVLGRSGSGKSTLLAMLGGLCRPTRGTVTLHGVDIGSLPPNDLARFRNRQVGFVFQFASLLPTLRAVDNVALPALVGDRENAEAVYRRAEDLLARVGLAERLESYPHELSGGQQRRVALARALINAPPLILADEPTSDLDEEAEAEVFRLLLDLHREHGSTLLVVTHNTDLASEADRVIRLRNGRIVAETAHEREPYEGVDERSLPAERAEITPLAEVQHASRRLGTDFGRFLKAVAAWAAVVVLSALLTDYGTALYQQSRATERKAAKQQLQEVALYLMRADIEDVARGPDGGYLLTLYAQNLEPEKGLFVLAPEVRAFVQVGLQWQEIPLQPADDQEGSVVRVSAEKHPFRFRFTPDVKTFEQILPGYMHVRFSNAMLVSRSAEPRGDLVERLDDYYIYLKPSDADDAAILSKTKFPGKPPLWIPMPPH